MKRARSVAKAKIDPQPREAAARSGKARGAVSNGASRAVSSAPAELWPPFNNPPTPQDVAHVQSIFAHRDFPLEGVDLKYLTQRLIYESFHYDLIRAQGPLTPSKKKIEDLSHIINLCKILSKEFTNLFMTYQPRVLDFVDIYVPLITPITVPEAGELGAEQQAKIISELCHNFAGLEAYLDVDRATGGSANTDKARSVAPHHIMIERLSVLFQETFGEDASWHDSDGSSPQSSANIRFISAGLEFATRHCPLKGPLTDGAILQAHKRLRKKTT